MINRTDRQTGGRMRLMTTIGIRQNFGWGLKISSKKVSMMFANNCHAELIVNIFQFELKTEAIPF